MLKYLIYLLNIILIFGTSDDDKMCRYKCSSYCTENDCSCDHSCICIGCDSTSICNRLKQDANTMNKSDVLIENIVSNISQVCQTSITPDREKTNINYISDCKQYGDYKTKANQNGGISVCHYYCTPCNTYSICAQTTNLLNPIFSEYQEESYDYRMAKGMIAYCSSSYKILPSYFLLFHIISML